MQLLQQQPRIQALLWLLSFANDGPHRTQTKTVVCFSLWLKDKKKTSLLSSDLLQCTMCFHCQKITAFCFLFSLVDFEEPEDPSTRSFFSEIISSISDVKFSHNGRYLMTRDYLTVKVWDLQMENKPLETYQVSFRQAFMCLLDGSKDNSQLVKLANSA